MSSIGQKLLHRRKEQHLSQEELAQESGISLRTIQRIEKGTVNPHGHTLVKLATALDIDPADLETESGQTQQNELGTLNALGLLVIIFPVVHLLVQLLFWRKQKESLINMRAEAARIVSFQVFWVLATLVAFGLIHIISFIIAGQSAVGHFPYRLITYVFLLLLNVGVITKTAVQLNKQNPEILKWVPALV